MTRGTGKNKGNNSSRSFQLLLVAVVTLGALVFSGRGWAQDKTASVHGHVNNEIGSAIANATVRFTKDPTTDPKKAKWLYTFPVDPSGDYKGTGIAPDSYLVVVVVGDSSLDYFQDQAFKASEDKLLNFDMGRKEFIDKLSPERKQQIEDFKKKQADAMAANKSISNLNAALKQARDDNKSGNYQAAATAMTQATTQKPDESILWFTLGEAQYGLADTAVKAAKAANQSTTDPALLQKFSDAAASYKKAVDLNAASKKPSPETAGASYNQLGQAYARSGDIKSASDAYDQAAKADPTKAGTYYLNEAVVLYTASKTDDAAVAADKAIAADPNRADAYYIKGQSLIQKVTIDPKTQKPVAPPGCLDAYQKYLELAPDGPHASEVKEILTGMGEQVKSTYKSKKK